MFGDELREAGELLYPLVKKIFEVADDIDSVVDGLDLDSGVEAELIAAEAPRLAELRTRACEAFEAIEAKLTNSQALDRLVTAFTDFEAQTTLGAALRMEREIIERSGYDGDLDSGSIGDLLGEFRQALLVAGNPEGRERDTKVVTRFEHRDAEKAFKSIKRMQNLLCDPEQAMVNAMESVEEWKYIARLCRDVGILTADVAGVCVGISDLTGLLLFTSAKSVITSSIRINTGVDTLRNWVRRRRRRRYIADNPFPTIEALRDQDPDE